MSRKQEWNRFQAQEAESSLAAISSLESAREKLFMNSTYIMSRKWESNVFGLRTPKWVWQPSASSNRREKNFSWTPRTSCLESRNQTFCAQEAEMGLTPISSLESAREKLFMNSTYIMSRKKESNVFGLRRSKWVWQPSASSNRREENFSWTRRTSCLESRNQTFLGSGRRNESDSHQLVRIGERKIFHELHVHHV